ncbi:MAG: hypothetical protein RIT26_1836 [Pseudomonadota bacterium]
MTSLLKLWRALALCWSGLALMAQAAEPHGHPARAMAVKPFDEMTWATLLGTGPRPAAYMFTTTYCSACPAVFRDIRNAAQNSKTRPELIVVLMDADGPGALRHASHFKGTTQLFAFDGYEPAIRSTIDPTWRNITPYVVLLDRQGGVQRGVGSPTPQSLRQWLQPSPAQRP